MQDRGRFVAYNIRSRSDLVHIVHGMGRGVTIGPNPRLPKIVTFDAADICHWQPKARDRRDSPLLSILSKVYTALGS